MSDLEKERMIGQSIIKETIKTFVDENISLKSCLQILGSIKSFMCMRKLAKGESLEEILKIINDTNVDDGLFKLINENSDNGNRWDHEE